MKHTAKVIVNSDLRTTGEANFLEVLVERQVLSDIVEVLGQASPDVGSFWTLSLGKPVNLSFIFIYTKLKCYLEPTS